MGGGRKRWEFRRIPYRPERTEHGGKGDSSLVLRFLKSYVWPHKWSVLLCIVLMSANACSAYIQGFYNRIAVDDILKIGNVRETAQRFLGDGSVVSLRRADEESASGARRASGHISDAGRKDEDTRPAWAGRRLFALYLLYIATVALFNAAVRVVQRTQSRVSKAITQRLREEMHAKVIGMAMSYHMANSPGRLMSRILSDVDVVQTMLMELVVTASSQIIMFIVGLAILFSISPPIALAVLGAMVPYVFAAARIRKKVYDVNVELRHTNSCLWGYVSQKLDAVKAIIAYGRERMESLIFRRLSSCLLRDTVRQQLNASLQTIARVIHETADRGIFVVCAYFVLSGRMTLGTMLYINGAICTLFVPVNVLTQLAVQLSVLFVVLQRISHTLGSDQEIREDPSGVDFPMPVHTGIRLRNVTFGWGDGRPNVIDNISLDVPVGSWLCIMGASGCGKSTLLKLIARLYDPKSGEIDVDGIDISHMNFASLRRSMAYVPQEAQILSGTIRDNIIYGRPDATPSMIMEAAMAADAHGFIMDMPVKYETVTGEKGTTLSGGQRQRISIARALLTKPEILILDDCTSALDANTERKLQDTFGKILAGKTAVIVSQRVSMAMRCQKIIVLGSGRIMEEGTHGELLSKGGYYANLCKIQCG